MICLVKGAAAGFLAGLVYQLVRGNAPETGVRSFVASLLASVTAPVVNTGLFILGGLTLVRGTLEANLAVFGWTSDSVLLFLVIGCAGINFLAEFAANLILSPAIHRHSCGSARTAESQALNGIKATPARPSEGGSQGFCYGWRQTGRLVSAAWHPPKPFGPFYMMKYSTRVGWMLKRGAAQGRSPGALAPRTTRRKEMCTK